MMQTAGSTAHFTVRYDDTIATGPALAAYVLDYCEYDFTRLQIMFGGITPPNPIEIDLVPGGGGAGWGGTTMNCYCSGSTQAEGLPALIVAELAEMFMAAQGQGWIANWSNGEALSRILGGVLYPNRAPLFATGTDWLNSARPDWINSVEHTDLHFPSIGCGTLFLNYLAYQLNYTWDDIVAAGAPTTNTLAETATILGSPSAFTDFSNLIQTHFPPGTPVSWDPLIGDEYFPLGQNAVIPALYMRHNLADDGTTHTGSLSDSPDIIMRNDPVANPQATFSTPASIASDTESDAFVIEGQDNYLYPRIWNRGMETTNVFSTVYWSPPATLVAPDQWNLLGSAYFPDVPNGPVEVARTGIVWPSDHIPAPGHYCFVASVGNPHQPAPTASTFATFDDFVNFIYANNDFTWRNFNVGMVMGLRRFGDLGLLPFHIRGAWDRPRRFDLEIEADMPQGSRLILDIPQWFARELKPRGKHEEHASAELDRECPDRAWIHLNPHGGQHLGEVLLHERAAIKSHLLVEVPRSDKRAHLEISIRQIYRRLEVGRLTWRLHHHG